MAATLIAPLPASGSYNLQLFAVGAWDTLVDTVAVTRGTNNKALGESASTTATGDHYVRLIPTGDATTTRGEFQVKIPASGQVRVTERAAPDWAQVLNPTSTVGLTGTYLHSFVRKNQALAAFQFLMTDSTTHLPATGKTVTVTRLIDGGAFGAGTLSAVTEVGSGIYRTDFAAADLNGTNILLMATATGCDTTFERIITQP